MIIALNNKSNLTKEEFLNYQKDLTNIKSESTLILCPTHLNIGNYNLTNFSLGAQNVSSFNKGFVQLIYAITSHSQFSAIFLYTSLIDTELDA